MPVASYAPELLQIYELASQKPFRFDCGNNKKAHAFRWRLHSLRRAMREENHWLLPIAESVIISIEPDAKTGTVVCAHPPDQTTLSDLQKALKEQGAELLAEAKLENEPEEYKNLPETKSKEEESFRHSKTPISDKANKSNLSANAIDNYLKKGN